MPKVVLTRRTGGGAKLFFFAPNAEGVGGAAGGGVAVLLAVEFRNEVKVFFGEETSTSPNFYVHMANSRFGAP